jgi:hypothetical protein
MPIGLVDLLYARAHEAGELEQRDARRDRKRGVGMAKRVGRAVREACGADGRRPFVGSPLVNVQMPATLGREEQAGIEPRR